MERWLRFSLIEVTLMSEETHQLFKKPNFKPCVEKSQNNGTLAPFIKNRWTVFKVNSTELETDFYLVKRRSTNCLGYDLLGKLGLINHIKNFFISNGKSQNQKLIIFRCSKLKSKTEFNNFLMNFKFNFQRYSSIKLIIARL